MKSFLDKENECKQCFAYGGTFWHAYTSGIETPDLFINDDDFKFVMNVIAQAVYELQTNLLSFEIMNNHFHFVILGTEQNVNDFFCFLVKRIRRTIPEISSVNINMKSINDLYALRNTIVYVHRNGYVVNSIYTPFSYPWSTGSFYSPLNKLTENNQHVKFSELTIAQKRNMFRGRAPKLPDSWIVISGVVSPQSYCNINLGLSMFRDAHHYFVKISNDLEALHKVAVEINDYEFLTDIELYEEVIRIINVRYNLKYIKELSKYQKVEMVKCLRYNFRSTNSQISRVLRMPQFDVDQILP